MANIYVVYGHVGFEGMEQDIFFGGVTRDYYKALEERERCERTYGGRFFVCRATDLDVEV